MNKSRLKKLEQASSEGQREIYVCHIYPGQTRDDAIKIAREKQGVEKSDLVVYIKHF